MPRPCPSSSRLLKPFFKSHNFFTRYFSSFHSVIAETSFVKPESIRGTAVKQTSWQRYECLNTAIPSLHSQVGRSCNLVLLIMTQCQSSFYFIHLQVNLFQKHLFLHQLTHNMKKDCSLNYKFSTWKLQAQNMGRTCCVHKLFWMSKQKQKSICVQSFVILLVDAK